MPIQVLWTTRGWGSAIGLRATPSALHIEDSPFAGDEIRQRSPVRGGAENGRSRWRSSVSPSTWMANMGPQSEGVCFDFQRAEKLDVDGVIGPETWAAAFTRK
ncbi:MAG TPA: peptidoglycan-binding domain-containing protein [Actinomycetota bacterium]